MVFRSLGVHNEGMHCEVERRCGLRPRNSTRPTPYLRASGLKTTFFTPLSLSRSVLTCLSFFNTFLPLPHTPPIQLISILHYGKRSQCLPSRTDRYVRTTYRSWYTSTDVPYSLLPCRHCHHIRSQPRQCKPTSRPTSFPTRIPTRTSLELLMTFVLQAMMGALLTHTASEISVSNAVPSFFDTPPAQTAPCVGNYDSGASVSCDSSGTYVATFCSPPTRFCTTWLTVVCALLARSLRSTRRVITGYVIRTRDRFQAQRRSSRCMRAVTGRERRGVVRWAIMVDVVLFALWLGVTYCAEFTSAYHKAGLPTEIWIDVINNPSGSEYNG